MSCDCEFEARDDAQRSVLRTLLLVNGAMFVTELVVGILADSSGVIADSLDMLADALVYGISLYAIGRAAAVKLRAARWSGWFQIVLAVGIFADVLRRGVFGSEPTSLLMSGISVVALGANAWCLKLLSSHRDGEVHMRASWIFTRSDVIANLGVLLAAGLVTVTHSRWPDLVIGAAISAVVIQSGWSILRDVRRESVPPPA